jgi:diguanylate cyclase (GGDEF)-like protein
MIPFISAVLVLIGLFIQIATLVPLHRLVAIVPAGTIRKSWLVMAGLIFIFIGGYLGYIVVLWGQQAEWNDLLIPSVLLFGAIFVWLTIKLSLLTATDIRRLDFLEVENITDPLTKVYNRRYLDRRLEEEIARSKRYSLDLSVFLLDIDHFKRINDTYGHQVGDLTLSTLGSLIKADLRDQDMVCRYGGEEFLIICTNTSIKGAALVADRLRHLIEIHPIEISDIPSRKKIIQITTSIGVASLNGNIESKEKLINAADQALYRAKQEGRNRVIVASQTESPPQH